MDEDTFIYRIDSNDIIVSVSQNWESFARDNAWGSELSPENVIGHLLWDFIQDIETRHLYEEVFRRVRAGMLSGPIPFRCDSPQERRFLKLLLSPLPDGQIEISSTIIRTERRDPVRLLDENIPRSNDIIRICSMCKKIFTTHNKWVEIEEGLAQLRPFEAGEMPKLTHGLCPDCYEFIIADLHDSEPRQKDIDGE
ncbi:MAG: hypothetical protein PVH37_21640 [Desulfobacterales bacterium]|jgi:hypothetical protein